MLGLIRDVFELVIFALVFTGGIKFNQKWPNAASYLTGVWTIAEKFITWLYGLFKATQTTTTK